MTPSTISCPACGADFDAGEQLEPATASDHTPAPDGPASAPLLDEPVSFHCPACGAEFETQEHLVEMER